MEIKRFENGSMKNDYDNKKIVFQFGTEEDMTIFLNNYYLFTRLRDTLIEFKESKDLGEFEGIPDDSQENLFD